MRRQAVSSRFNAPRAAATGDVERLVDRLVTDTRGRIVGEVERELTSDLLRAPRPPPAPVPPPPVSASRPGDFRPWDRIAGRRREEAQIPDPALNQPGLRQSRGGSNSFSIGHLADSGLLPQHEEALVDG